MDQTDEQVTHGTLDAAVYDLMFAWERWLEGLYTWAEYQRAHDAYAKAYTALNTRYEADRMDYFRRHPEALAQENDARAANGEPPLTLD